MPEPFTLERVDDTNVEVLHTLAQLYRHDLSQFRDSFPDESGKFRLGSLATVLDDDDVAAFLVRVGPRAVGFVSISGVATKTRSIAEFFVVRRLRRDGLGTAVAIEVLSRYRGHWEIAFQEENPAAARFWRHVASSVAGVAWSEQRRQDPLRDFIPPDTWILLAT